MRGGPSLDPDYFEGIFSGDEDPWDLASSPYEAAKFARTIEALSDRRYASALEIGCAHGVLTERLAALCDRILAVDISEAALNKARKHIGERDGITLRRMRFPQEVPAEKDFDLLVLSEVAYYWDDADLDRAAAYLAQAGKPGSRLILVHWTGETDYPQTGDGAVEILWRSLATRFQVLRAERHDSYRLDLWERR